MKRDKETSYYTFDTTSKFEHARSCDCVIRSISLATGKSWVEVFDGLCEIARKMYRVPNERAVYEKYLDSLGWKKQPAPKHDGNYKYLAKDFVKMLKKTAVVHVGGHHVSCFLNDKIHDIWNCGEGSVGNYWIKS
jgi:hypothetical protein